jgi:hypothetical protein
VRRFAVLAAWAGLTVLQLGVATAYVSLGTWWHWLLHQLVGWGVGLGAAALVTAATGRSVPAVVALLVGQLLSIVPDLQFRYARMPHEPSMDLWLGHISLHTGPSPVLVSLGALLLGGWGWIAARTAGAAGRRARRRRPRPGHRRLPAGPAGPGPAGRLPDRHRAAAAARRESAVTSRRVRPTLVAHWRGGGPTL